MAAQQSNIYLGHLGIERTNPDFYALQVLDTILGGGAGFTARIPQRLRDELGLAYTTFASITMTAGVDPGRFVAYIGTSPENTKLAIDGLLNEIRKISRSSPFRPRNCRTPRIFSQAASSLHSNRVLRLRVSSFRPVCTILALTTGRSTRALSRLLQLTT